MKYLALALLLAAVGLFGYDAGYLMPHVVKDPLTGFHEVACDEIVRNQVGVYCAVAMQQEDDPLKIYKEN